MNEQNFQDLIHELIDNIEEVGLPNTVRSTATFADADILTNNKGVVVTMKDGSEFQLTIVQSNPATRQLYE